MTQTKKHLIKKVYRSLELSKTESVKSVEAIIEIIKKTLESGEDVLISGFGKFCVKEKKKGRGRHPDREEDLMPDATRIIRFRCSSVLREKLNNLEEQ